MRKLVAISSFSLILTLSGITPAWADASVAGTVVTRVSSLVLGSIVGVPVQMVRRSKAEAITATKELVGESPKWWQLIYGAPLGVPAGCVSGLFQGVLYGPYTAWKYADKPFSAEAFSLSDAKPSK